MPKLVRFLHLGVEPIYQMVFVTYPSILMEISKARYGLGLLTSQKNFEWQTCNTFVLFFLTTQILNLRVLHFSR